MPRSPRDPYAREGIPAPPRTVDAELRASLARQARAKPEVQPARHLSPKTTPVQPWDPERNEGKRANDGGTVLNLMIQKRNSAARGVVAGRAALAAKRLAAALNNLPGEAA